MEDRPPLPDYRTAMNPPSEVNFKNFLQTQRLLHLALLFGPLVLGAYAVVKTSAWITNFDVNSDPLVYFVPIMAIAGYFASSFLYQKAINKVNTEDSLQQKLSAFQSASLLQYACLEGPTFLALAAFLSNSYVLYMLIALLLLAFLYTKRPTLEKIKQELRLNREEEEQLSPLKSK